VFGAFCRQIRVSNIREYEERQLKVAQEESEARLRFDTQIARLTHQYVSLLSLQPHIELRTLIFCFKIRIRARSDKGYY